MAKIPVFDWATGEFARDGLGRVPAEDGTFGAIEQIVIKAQQTERGVYLIYAPDPDLPDEPGDLYGSEVVSILGEDLDEETRDSELDRTIREAIIYDAYILAVYDTTLEVNGDSGKYTANVDHIYGSSLINDDLPEGG